MKMIKEIIKKNIEVVRFYRSSIFVLAILFLLSILYVIYTTYLPAGGTRIIFFDVGQGDSIYIESPTHTKVVIDGGAKANSTINLSKYISFFDRQIDLIIPTHADSDHITGLIENFKKYNVMGTLALHATSTTSIFETYEKEKEGDVYRGFSGDVIDIGGGAYLTILLPGDDESFSKEETNDSSTVVLLSYDGYTFLLMGDLPETREHALLANGLLPTGITVLKLGHHGSKYSTGDELLSYTHPRYVIISAGKDNKYGHPNQETLGRVNKIGAEVISTIDSGDIEFYIEKGSLKVKIEK